MNETSTEKPTVRETAADCRALPNLYEVAVAAAEKFGVCVRPVTMRVEDPKTGTVSYVGSPCKATVASVCKPCADKARYLRITQCREGWHAETEPVAQTREPTEWQTELLTARADLVAQYLEAKDDGDEDLMAAIREIVTDLDQELRACGLRGPLPPLDPKPAKRRARSTKRRQDVPDLPRKKVARNTIGRVYGGKYRPSMMVTLTMPSYGAINADGAVDKKTGQPCSDGSPCRPDEYDYPSAARDIVFCSALFDRWIQNLRRAVGYDVQYFAAVEPQKRGAPHFHVLLRTAIPRDILKLVTAATYHQVWWPHFDPDNEVYSGDRMRVWDHQAMTFVDPDTKRPLSGWDEALDVLDTVDDLKPAYTVQFGARMDPGDVRTHPRQGR